MLLTRLLISCLLVWFIDQVLAKFNVADPWKRRIQIVVIILAALFILLGWYFKLVLA